ncbi:hypothetical protein QFC22_000411 [Naganishia vaughanmartiniae]|uniref:Uncharacterized protein n=1 Tax=Naganishia vaughanmartiniae TaxID=1424756 RepID=A0ACC2XP99_9TREE|nr:hypothetical protein QFC22_000411 [Naganishia vaughanmartiniae]
MFKHNSTSSSSSTSYERVTESVNHPLLKGITDKRLRLFTGGHFASQNLSSILERDRIDDREHVKMCVWSAPGESKPKFQEATQAFAPGKAGTDEGSKEYKKGDRLGPSWTNHWVHVELTIPRSFQSANEPVIFEFDPECEALIFTPQGKALHAITGGPNSDKDGVPGNQEDRRVQHVIPQAAVDAGIYEVIIEVSCNGMFGLGMNGYRHQRPDPNRYFSLAFADIVLINSEAVNLELDFEMVRQVAQSADREHSSLSHRALRVANDMMNAFRASNHYQTEEQLSAAIEKCRRIAARVLGDMSEERRKTLCTASRESGPDAKMWAIGHCHIDTAWLWSYSVTQQKIARSWSTQIDLMRRFPNHQFAASSAQQYAWLEELYPDIFEDVTEMVKADRFIPVGGAWIEHDCILPSGESLCRQYLYGQRYFEEKFGIRSKEAWLPDTFGYASQLPQILRLAGMEYFFTQKASLASEGGSSYS